jgi:muramoyltetrapeptide carboxypeptidase
MKYERLPIAENRSGEGVGELVGGNLSIIQMMDGSVSDLKTDEKILFIEDVGEYAYKIDGMLWNLKRSGKLDHLKGLIVGEFRIKPDDAGEEFGKTIYDIVMEKIHEYNYPVCFDFPVGHVKENYALKCGVKHRLVVDQQKTILQEI